MALAFSDGRYYNSPVDFYLDKQNAKSYHNENGDTQVAMNYDKFRRSDNVEIAEPHPGPGEYSKQWEKETPFSDFGKAMLEDTKNFVQHPIATVGQTLDELRLEAQATPGLLRKAFGLPTQDVPYLDSSRLDDARKALQSKDPVAIPPTASPIDINGDKKDPVDEFGEKSMQQMQKIKPMEPLNDQSK